MSSSPSESSNSGSAPAPTTGKNVLNPNCFFLIEQPTPTSRVVNFSKTLTYDANTENAVMGYSGEIKTDENDDLWIKIKVITITRKSDGKTDRLYGHFNTVEAEQEKKAVATYLASLAAGTSAPSEAS